MNSRGIDYYRKNLGKDKRIKIHIQIDNLHHYKLYLFYIHTYIPSLFPQYVKKYNYAVFII